MRNLNKIHNSFLILLIQIQMIYLLVLLFNSSFLDFGSFIKNFPISLILFVIFFLFLSILYTFFDLCKLIILKSRLKSWNFDNPEKEQLSLAHFYILYVGIFILFIINLVFYLKLT